VKIILHPTGSGRCREPGIVDNHFLLLLLLLLLLPVRDNGRMKKTTIVIDSNELFKIISSDDYDMFDADDEWIIR
jgi:hypothetical protein